MTIELNFETKANAITYIELIGSLDTLGAQAVDIKFNAIAGGHDLIIVDFEKVDYLSSMGIRTVITGAKAVHRRNGKMVIVNPNFDVNKVLTESGVDTLIPIVKTSEEAEKLCLGN
jgi:stage II sporulation protein AA (anti-sigma F factor antagonist)